VTAAQLHQNKLKI